MRSLERTAQTLSARHQKAESPGLVDLAVGNTGYEPSWLALPLPAVIFPQAVIGAHFG